MSRAEVVKAEAHNKRSCDERMNWIFSFYTNENQEGRDPYNLNNNGSQNKAFREKNTRSIKNQGAMIDENCITENRPVISSNSELNVLHNPFRNLTFISIFTSTTSLHEMIYKLQAQPIHIHEINEMKFFHAHFSHLRNIKWTYLQNLPAYWEKFQDDQQALRGTKSTHIDVKEPINLHYDGCSCMIINRIENYKVLYAQERRGRYLACTGRISDGLMGPQFPLASLHNVISLKQGRPHQLLYTHQQQWNQQT